MQKTPFKKYTLPVYIVLCLACLFLFTKNSIGQSVTWERIYNGQGNNSDGFRSICQADGDNIFAAGYTFLTGSLSSKRIYVVKLNAYGDTLWTRSIGDNFRPDALSLVSDGNGGCVITGGWDQAFTIRMNSNGVILWQKFYGGSLVQLYDIKKTPDGGYIACGRYDDANFNGLIIKIDSVGDLQWQRMYPAQFYKVFSSIEIAHDSGYMLVGRTSNNQQDYPKGFITKINNLGDTLWNRVFVIDTITGAEKIVKINNGYLIGGNINYRVLFNYSTFYLLRLNMSGDSVSARLYNTPKPEFVYDIKVLNENRYVVAGYVDSIDANILNGKVTITDSSFNIIKARTLPSPDYIVLYSILPQPNGDIVIAGEADMNINPIYNDAYAVRLDSNLNYMPIGIINISNILPDEIMLYPNYPNPFNPETMIKYDIPTDNIVNVKVYDLLGREVFSSTEYKTAGSHELRFDGTNLASGMYFYSIDAGKFRDVKKMVLLK